MLRKLIPLIVLLAACGGGRQTGPAAFEIGEAAVDGQFTFFIESFECGRSQVVNGVFRAQANGEFCLLELTVSNSGDQGRRFLAASQALVNREGGQLNPANDATLVVSPGAANEELNPGLSLKTTVVFDVADPDDIEFARLRDAPLSQGVLVRIDS